MPVYEFRCPQKHTTEEFFRGKEATAAIVCKRCGMEAARIISMPRVKVKPAAESPAATVRRLQGAKRGEQFCDNRCIGGSYLRLKGSKEQRRRDIVNDVMKSDYAKTMEENGMPLTESDITPTNL